MRTYRRIGVRYLQAKRVKRLTADHEARLERERIAFAQKLNSLQERGYGARIIYMDQTTFQLWHKPAKTWQSGAREVKAAQQLKYLSAVTLYGAVGKPLKDGSLYMTAGATNIVETKRFLIRLAGALKNQYGPRPYLCLDNHRAHHSPRVREELARFIVCFQPAYTSPANCQETIWAQLKHEYQKRIHRRDKDLRNDAEFEAMIRQLYSEVPINVDAILRANRGFINQYLALGAEQSSESV